MKNFVLKLLLGNKGFHDYQTLVSQPDSKGTKVPDPVGEGGTPEDAEQKAGPPTAPDPLIGKTVRGTFIRNVDLGILVSIGQKKAGYAPAKLFYKGLKKAAALLGLKASDIKEKTLYFKVIALAANGSYILEFDRVPEDTIRKARSEIEARNEQILATLTAMKVGDKLPVKIKNLVGFGASVETDTGFSGLIRLSEVGDGTLAKWPTELHKIGDVVEARILNVDIPQRMISFSLRAE
jgi:ribosomal protein S1